jgi:hypothetical protein
MYHNYFASTTKTLLISCIISIIVVAILVDPSLITRTSNSVEAFQNYPHHHLHNNNAGAGAGAGAVFLKNNNYAALHNNAGGAVEQHKQQYYHYATLGTPLCSEYSTATTTTSPRLPKIRLQQQVQMIFTQVLEEVDVDDDNDNDDNNDDTIILGQSSSSSSSSSSTATTRLNNINNKKSSSSNVNNSNSYNIASIWANSLESKIPLHAGSRLWLEKNKRRRK